MTALAGLWRTDGGDAWEGERRILQSQAMYGQHVRDWAEGPMAMGRTLFRLLPEDKADLGIQLGAEGTLALAADVRLDNRAELGAALAIADTALARLADSALVMRCIEAWGESAIERLRGDFALALWNARERRLLLARDFLGQRPLHYHRGKGFVAFASMPKGLHALPEIPRSPNEQAVASFLALIPETDPETFFEGINKVLPGHVVTVTELGIRSRRYWTPPTAELRLRDPREYEEAVRAELDRAVAIRLRGAGNAVASHLSGGLDSSAVTATAARALANNGHVIAYTAVPQAGHAPPPAHSIADEGPLAALVAAAFPNIEHIKIAASGSAPTESLDRYFHAFERPLLNLCNGVWMTAIMDDVRARRLPVLLTGQNGNMSFSFDGMTALPRMLRQGRWLTLGRTAASLLRNGSRLGTVGAQVLGPYLPASVWRGISRLRGKGRTLGDYTMLHPDLHGAMASLAQERGLDVGYRPRRDPHEMRTWVLQRVDHGNYNKGFLGGWGIDVRDPTADQRLVELCLTIPTEQYLAGGVPRSLARRAFADRLPADLLNERKKGYQAADWHKGLVKAQPELAEEIDRCASADEISSIVATERMKQLVAEFPDGGWDRPRTVEQYRLALLRGVSAAHFLRKAMGANA